MCPGRIHRYKNKEQNQAWQQHFFHKKLLFYRKVCVSDTDISTFVVGRSLGVDRPGTARGRYKKLKPRRLF